MELTGPDARLLGRLLAASELRHRVLASNLANANTPGYKRQVVDFEERLRQALVKGSPDTLTLAPTVRTDEETPARPDGNNVTLEAELNGMRENRLLYETYAAILASHFSMLDYAITGGN